MNFLSCLVVCPPVIVVIVIMNISPDQTERAPPTRPLSESKLQHCSTPRGCWFPAKAPGFGSSLLPLSSRALQYNPNSMRTTESWRRVQPTTRRGHLYKVGNLIKWKLAGSKTSRGDRACHSTTKWWKNWRYRGLLFTFMQTILNSHGPVSYANNLRKLWQLTNRLIRSFPFLNILSWLKEEKMVLSTLELNEYH